MRWRCIIGKGGGRSMIRFACGNCKAILSHPTTGVKVQCPKCGQKILVPSPPAPPPQNKTVLGELVQDAPSAPAPVERPLPGMRTVACPGCAARVAVAGEVGVWANCPRCEAFFMLQAARPSQATSPPAATAAGPPPAPVNTHQPARMVVGVIGSSMLILGLFMSIDGSIASPPAHVQRSCRCDVVLTAVGLFALPCPRNQGLAGGDPCCVPCRPPLPLGRVIPRCV